MCRGSAIRRRRARRPRRCMPKLEVFQSLWAMELRRPDGRERSHEESFEMVEAEGVEIQFETHRNCITNDLFTTLLLLDAVPEMRLCADLSHYLVDREFWYPIAPENHALIRRILERADSFQGRVSSREQIQVQISF